MTTTPHEAQLPEVLLLPIRTAVDPGQQAQLALRRTVAGELLAPAYSGLDRLVAGAGEHQPWVAVPSADLPALLAGSGVRCLLLDVSLLPEVPGDA